MKRAFRFIYLLLGLSVFQIFTVIAQPTVEANSLLWEISGNELNQKSYLFGTIHIIPEKDFFLTENMIERFNSCKVLALELDLDTSFKSQIVLLAKIFLPNNKTLADYMDEKDYNQFSSYVMDSLKIKEKKFNKYIRLKPFFSYSLIITDLLGETLSYEQTFSKMAKTNKMRTVGLETIEFQMSVIDKISIEDQVSVFLDNAQNGRYAMINEFNEMLNLYKQQDLDGLYQMIDSDKSITNYEEEFIVKRNKNWIPKIEKLTRQNCAFIAVGAGHLAGENGVINLLRQRGYTVTPVN